MKTALVLGGGGARGLAHIGVLKVLEEIGCRPDLIVGCSIGAIVGGMYAQNPDSLFIEREVNRYFASEEYQNLNIRIMERNLSQEGEDDFLNQIARNLQKRVLLNLVANRQAILKEDKFSHTIDYFISDGDIAETEIPFACNATDLIKGEPVLFTMGAIRTAIKASSTIPGYLAPVGIDSRVLVDGAVTYPLPIHYARMLGADRVLAVDVKPSLRPQVEFKNVFDILMRSNAITAAFSAKQTGMEADVTISPGVGEYSWYDFRQMNRIIEAGELSAKARVGDIRKKIMGKDRGFFQRFFQ